MFKNKSIWFLNKTITIHTVGDSHAKIPWDNISLKNIDIDVHHLGPRLMHTVSEKPWLTSVKNFNIKKKDIIIYCFGEIDCRCHIWKHRSKGYKNVINSLVDEYFSAIIKSTKKLRRDSVYIQSVVPAIRRKQQLHNEVKDLPFLGKDEDRKKYVEYMNYALEKSCKKHGFSFFNVYDFYSDRDGFLDYELSDRSVHIGNPKFIKQHLSEILKSD